MSRHALSIEALPAWSLLNDITFVDVKVANTEGRGYGLVCERSLTTKEGTFDIPTLLTVPHGLVLNAEAVEQYAKEDKNFRQLLDAAGHKSVRGDILLFLLVQLVLASGESPSAGLSNPWTEYVKLIPSSIPLPTLWSEDEQRLLAGTSLEAALKAKLKALNTEFDALQDITTEIPCWNEALWGKGLVSRRDWAYLDAVYRSRVLELPRSGESMVPCVDMVNHSAEPTAYYDENAKDEVSLLLRPGVSLSEGDEVTISYGEDKSAAEMLFSYGFLDPKSPSASALFPLEPFGDDPLAKAKLIVYGKPPQVQLSRVEGRIVWSSPFAYLMCVNEEDGLDFRVLQDNDGSRQLRVFWQEEDVTDKAEDFEELTRSYALRAILKLRVATVVEECLQTHVVSMHAGMPPDMGAGSTSWVRDECALAAAHLRDIETNILEEALLGLEEEKSQLMADEEVVAYLGSMEDTQTDLVSDEASNEEEDFS